MSPPYKNDIDIFDEILFSVYHTMTPRYTSKGIHYNMTVWISFTIAAGLIRLHMPGVKKSRV